MRRAADARAVVVAIERASGVPLHVLDHREEGLLTLLGATSGRAVEAELLVVDVGGGSTQLVAVGPGAPGERDRAARRRRAPHAGARDPRSTDAGRDRGPPGCRREALAAAPDAAPMEIVAVGGTASNLVKILPDAVDDRALTPERLAIAFDTLGDASAAEIAARFAIRPQRARILAAGAALVEAILARYGSPRATASEEGIREGTVLALARAGAAWRDRLEELAHGWGADGAEIARGPPAATRRDRDRRHRPGTAGPFGQRPLTARPRRRRKATPLTPSPRGADRAAQALELALAALQVGRDHLGLGRGEATGIRDQELAGQRDRDVRVVQPAQVVLERHDARDELVHLRAQGLAEELQRVAEPLAGDPELVDRLDVGPAQDALVAPDLLVGQPDPRAGRVADAVRGDRAGRREDGRALGSDEDPVLLDEPGVGARSPALARGADGRPRGRRTRRGPAA